MELFGITQKPYVIDINYYDKPDSYGIISHLQVFEDIDDCTWHVIIVKRQKGRAIERIDIWREEWKTIDDTYECVKSILATSGKVLMIQLSMST